MKIACNIFPLYMITSIESGFLSGLFSNQYFFSILKAF